MPFVTVTIILCVASAVFGGFVVRRYDRDISRKCEYCRSDLANYRMLAQVAREEFNATQSKIDEQVKAGRVQIEQNSELLEELKKRLVEVQSDSVRAEERLKGLTCQPIMKDSREWRNR